MPLFTIGEPGATPLQQTRVKHGTGGGEGVQQQQAHPPLIGLEACGLQTSRFPRELVVES